jgi:signal transduction histidine kinase
MRTRTKIALWLIVSSVALFLFLVGSIYYSLYDYSFDDFFIQMKTRVTLAARFEFDTDHECLLMLKLLKEEHIENLENERVNFYNVSSPEGLKRIANNSKLPESYLKKIYHNGYGNLRKGKRFYTGIKYFKEGQSYLVILSATNYYATHHLRFVGKIIVICILVFTFLSVFLAYFFSKHIFDPIQNISNKVKEISTSNLHLRLDEENDDNEITHLAATFNDLLNRLETAFEVQKNFISNASHDFLTPLTCIIGEAEVILMKARDVQEYKDAVSRILIQSERLHQIIQGLLNLAEIGYRNKAIDIELVRTDELIYEAKAIIDNLNPSNNILIDLSLLPEDSKNLKIFCNKSLLTIALTNILTNACKYSNNQLVKISIASSTNFVLIIISDRGIGIPHDEIQFIFDPFFRASNTQNYEGYGIGLPLCRSILKILNGQLNIISTVNVGTTVELRLPIANIKD